MPPTLAQALSEYRTQMELIRGPMVDDDLVFVREDGSPMLPLSVSHAFRRIAKKAGLAGVRLHDLRHTHATFMLRR